MLRLADVLKTDVSEEHIGSIIRVTRIGALGATLAVNRKPRSVLLFLVMADVVPSSSILFSLITEAILSSETSVLTRATQRNIPEDSIPHGDFSLTL
jgi:hypothetical protein